MPLPVVEPVPVVQVHTFTPAGLVVEVWEEALCIPLELDESEAAYIAGEELRRQWLASGGGPGKVFHGAAAMPGPVFVNLPGATSGTLGWQQSALNYLAPPVAPAPPAPPTRGHVSSPRATPLKSWMSTPYSIDGFNSLVFVVEGLSACHWGFTLDKIESSGVLRYRARSPKHSKPSVAARIRAALAEVFPGMASELWRLQVV